MSTKRDLSCQKDESLIVVNSALPLASGPPAQALQAATAASTIPQRCVMPTPRQYPGLRVVPSDYDHSPANPTQQAWAHSDADSEQAQPRRRPTFSCRPRTGGLRVDRRMHARGRWHARACGLRLRRRQLRARHLPLRLVVPGPSWAGPPDCAATQRSGGTRTDGMWPRLCLLWRMRMQL